MPVPDDEGAVDEQLRRRHELELAPADTSGDLFVCRRPKEQCWTPVTFYRLASGDRYVHYGVRATPKVDG